MTVASESVIDIIGDAHAVDREGAIAGSVDCGDRGAQVCLGEGVLIATAPSGFALETDVAPLLESCIAVRKLLESLTAPRTISVGSRGFVLASLIVSLVGS